MAAGLVVRAAAGLGEGDPDFMVMCVVRFSVCVGEDDRCGGRFCGPAEGHGEEKQKRARVRELFGVCACMLWDLLVSVPASESLLM